MPLAFLHLEALSQAKVSLSSQKVSHTDPWLKNNNNKSRTVLFVTLSFQKCCEEGKIAGVHLTLNCSRIGKLNLPKAEKTIQIPKRFQKPAGSRILDAWFSPESRNTLPYKLLLATTPSKLSRIFHLPLVRPAARGLRCSQLAPH